LPAITQKTISQGTLKNNSEFRDIAQIQVKFIITSISPSPVLSRVSKELPHLFSTFSFVTNDLI